MIKIIGVLIAIFIWLLNAFLEKRGKLKIGSKRIITGCILGVLTITLLSDFMNLDKILFKFYTPEKLCEVAYLKKPEEIIYGKETAMLIIKKDRINVSSVIIPEEDGAWKIGNVEDTKVLSTRYMDDYSVIVYQYADSNEYYIQIMDIHGYPLEIVDENTTSFVCVKAEMELSSYETQMLDGKDLNTTYYTYFGYLESFNENYVININGNNYKVLEDGFAFE